jgi:hypothetical protein
MHRQWQPDPVARAAAEPGETPTGRPKRTPGGTFPLTKGRAGLQEPLVPRQDSRGGKQKLGPISKQGDRYLRRILVVGAIAVLRRAQDNPGKYPWLTQLLARRPFKVVAVGARQQDGAHGLGAAGPWWHLSGA